MPSFTQVLVFAGLAFIPLASAHGLITAASGDVGGAGIGLGVSSATSNNLQEVTQFNGNGFGTVGDLGNLNDLSATLATSETIAGSTLPQLSNGGTLTMTFRQLNDDGAGPINCSVSADATGDSYVAMEVTTQVPGVDGRQSTDVSDTPYPLVAVMPAGVSCTGTIGNTTGVCVVQCKNPAGPFGSNVIVQTPGSAGSSAAGNSTGTTPPASSASAAAPAETSTEPDDCPSVKRSMKSKSMRFRA